MPRFIQRMVHPHMELPLLHLPPPGPFRKSLYENNKHFQSCHTGKPQIWF